MADNKVSNPGAGGATFATDEIAGIDWPFAKLAWGPRDTANLALLVMLLLPVVLLLALM